MHNMSFILLMYFICYTHFILFREYTIYYAFQEYIYYIFNSRICIKPSELNKLILNPTHNTCSRVYYMEQFSSAFGHTRKLMI